MERKKGFEPSTLALARRCSTAELLPHLNCSVGCPFMGEKGLEPPRPLGHKILSLARLPVPPLALVTFTI